MSYDVLLANLGFDIDPFSKTNADEELNLSDYFVSPPFFAAVHGDHNDPKSALVFAPRGGGKTALKRKIELSSVDQPFLCVTYNEFNVTGLSLAQIDLGYHLRNLVQLTLVATITAASQRGLASLSHDDRHLLYLLIKEHLSQIDQAELKHAISSVKNFSDQAVDLWNRFTGPIGLVLNSLLERIGMAKAEISGFEAAAGKLGPMDDRLKLLQSIANKLGYHSIYILVDRIDENALTGAADSSYKFVAPLIANLQILELPRVAFKLFLWNHLLDDYRKVARPDRIKYYELEWQHDQLQSMLSQRLRAHSRARVGSMDQIAQVGIDLGLDKTIAIFAQGSPRTMVRICKEILDQQSEIDSNAVQISSEAITRGFEKFSENLSRELFSDTVIRELKRTNRCDFTIRHIYSTVFKVTQPAGLSKVGSWENVGAVKQVGTIQETSGARKSNHYALASLPLAKHVFSKTPIAEFVSQKIRVCRNCDSVLLRDWDITSPQLCDECQRENH
jgi:hypothetical protein